MSLNFLAYIFISLFIITLFVLFSEFDKDPSTVSRYFMLLRFVSLSPAPSSCRFILGLLLSPGFLVFYLSFKQALLGVKCSVYFLLGFARKRFAGEG